MKVDDILAYSDEYFVNLAYKCFGFPEKGLKRRFKYRMTNRNIMEFKNFIGNIEGKRILAASGSAIPLFSLLDESNGVPKFIVGFDYSPKQVAYNYLVKNAIINLDHKGFLTFFGYNQKGKRTKMVKLMRKKIIKDIPSVLHPFVPADHELTRRDFILKRNAYCSFFDNKEDYNKIKKNIHLIKFFVFYLDPLCKKSLLCIFNKDFFNFIYLSNILDWVCWHNSVQDKNIKSIFSMLSKISSKNSIITIDHLTQRVTLLSAFLKKVSYVKKISYNLYIYHWDMYKILLNRI